MAKLPKDKRACYSPRQHMIAPTAPRSTISEELEGLRISTPPPRKLFSAIFLLFWLIIWYLALRETGRKVVRDPLSNLFETIWLCAWTLGGGWVIAYWFWNLFGWTVLTVRSDTLTLRQSILGLSRIRVFNIQDMSNLRFVSGSWGLGKGRRANHIAFDYGTKTKWFASEIQEAEANIVIRKVLDRARIPTTPLNTER